MKILYTLSSTKGLGADRWIYEGYKRAFEASDCDFFTIEDGTRLRKAIQFVSPQMVILDYAWFLKNTILNDLELAKLSLAKALRKTKIFCQIGSCLDKETFGEKELEILKKLLPLFDEIWTWNAPEVYSELENKLQKPIRFIPHAADSFVYYPDKAYPEFECDIAFIGSRYTAKPFLTKELLPALKKKYKVRVYGAGWTFGDKVLRVCQKLARKTGQKRIANFTNQKRSAISQDNERKIYASAKICLNFHEYYKDGTSKNFEVERTFKIPACGGLQVTDYCKGLERYFDLTSEIVVLPQYRSVSIWLETIDWLLKNEKKREEIRLAGQKKASSKHAYNHRIKQLLQLI